MIAQHIGFVLENVVLAWVALSYVNAIVGGWLPLAMKFPRPPGVAAVKTRRMVSLRLSPLRSYFMCVDLGADERGLYASILPFFRIGHRPLLISWKDLVARGIEETFTSRNSLYDAGGLTVKFESAEAAFIEQSRARFAAAKTAFTAAP